MTVSEVDDRLPVRSPLRPKELALWLFDSVEPEAGAFNISVAFRVAGPLRWWPLHAAVQHLVGRYPVLRTRFPEVGGAPVREEFPSAEATAMVRIETISTSDEALAADVRKFSLRPFDLASDLQLRVAHLVGASSGEVVCLTAQHIVFDGTSVNIVLRELLETFEHFAADAELPDHLTGVIAPYVEEPSTAESRRFWREYLRGSESSPRLLHFSRGRERHSYRGAQLSRELSPRQTATLAALSKEVGVTPSIALFTLYGIVLAQHGAGEDMVVGVPVDIRGSAHAGAVGYHVNVIGLRTALPSANSFRTLARTSRDSYLRGLAHAGTPVEEVLLDGADAVRDRHNPVFRHLFNFRQSDLADLARTRGLELLDIRSEFVRLDVELVALSLPDTVLLKLSYSDELFRADEMTTLMDRLGDLLESCGRSPDRPIREVASWSPSAGAEVDGPAPADDPENHSGGDAELTGALAEIWREVLRKAELGDDAHFFRSGGTSLQAALVITRIKKVTGVALSLRDMFNGPTPAAMSARVASVRSAGK